MTTPQVTSEEIAKAREFLREVRAVCRKHGQMLSPQPDCSIVIWPLHKHGVEIDATTICAAWTNIDLNEG